MDRALREYRIRGVATNLAFLEAVLNHPKFRAGDYTTRFIDETPELFAAKKRRDRATKLLTYIGRCARSTAIPIRASRPKPPAYARAPEVPQFPAASAVEGSRSAFMRLGPTRFRRLDAGADARADHRHDDARRAPVASATRMRTHRHCGCRPCLCQGCRSSSRWNAGAARRLTSPCASSTKTRGSGWREPARATPNILTQMLLRGANGVGYTNYPDNVVRYFVVRRPRGGMDLFRIFDCLNWVENMRVSIDAVAKTGRTGGRRHLLYRRHSRS